MAELTCGPLSSTWLPEHGMVGASWRHADDGELLGQRGGLDSYLAKGSAFGIPLLAPWANRLDGLEYGDVVLDPEQVKLDGNGLPKDGVMAGRPWEVTGHSATCLTARFSSAEHPEVERAFPFPHAYAVTVELNATTLSVRTELTATADRAVPIAFGWHPLFTLPGVPRDEYVIEVPGVRESELDDRGIPTTDTRRPGGDLTDTEFREIAGDFTLSGGGRAIRVAFGAPDYPVGHVWAPAGMAFVAWEPMTAPTNALCSGDGLRYVEPGETFTAGFAMTYSPA